MPSKFKEGISNYSWDETTIIKPERAKFEKIAGVFRTVFAVEAEEEVAEGSFDEDAAVKVTAEGHFGGFRFFLE